MTEEDELLAAEDDDEGDYMALPDSMLEIEQTE